MSTFHSTHFRPVFFFLGCRTAASFRLASAAGHLLLISSSHDFGPTTGLVMPDCYRFQGVFGASRVLKCVCVYVGFSSILSHHFPETFSVFAVDPLYQLPLSLSLPKTDCCAVKLEALIDCLPLDDPTLNIGVFW